MSVFLSPIGTQTFFVPGGNSPASGAQLFTYVSGSSTKFATYTTSLGNVANANPMVMDSGGNLANGSGEIWLTQGQQYRFILAPSNDTDPPSSPYWSRDSITGINDNSFAASSTGEWIAFAGVATFVGGTSFTVPGDQTAIFTVDRRLKTINTGGTIYSTIVSSVFSSVTTITVVNDSGNLDAGLSTISYGLLDAANRSSPPINTLQDQTDPSKKLTFNISGLPSAKTRTVDASLSDSTCEGRLTLTSGTAVTTSDVTAATSIFFTPFHGNRIATYNGTFWNVSGFTEKTLAVPATTSTMYDVFIVDGTLALEALAWSSDTARATALTNQNGILVKSGDATRRYLGSFRTTSVSGQTEDSIAKRYLWNYYHRVTRKMRVSEATSSWIYTTGTYRQANNNSANQLDMVIGVSEEAVKATAHGGYTCAGANVQAQVGIGLDVTSTNSADICPTGSNAAGVPSAYGLRAEYEGFPGVGRHFLSWIEISEAAGTTTWYSNVSTTISPGAKAGIIGMLIG